MTIFSNSIFPTIYKYIKFGKESINVTSGANTLASLPLCDVKNEFEQYQRLSIQIPAGQNDFLLSFPTLGIKPTFLIIKPKYCTTDPTTKYLKWKFAASTDVKMSFTTILLFTGTSTNPVLPVVIDNPDTVNPVTLEVLVSATTNDYLNDVLASTYLSNLLFTNIHTFNETTSGIISIFNSLNELVTTVDISDIVNVNRVIGENRLIIDDASSNDIVLDFVTEYDTLQALSALVWVQNDPLNRALPKAPDTLAPVITFKPAVVLNAINVDLSLYTINTFTKQDFIDFVINTVTDDTDDSVLITVNDIIFKDNLNNEISNIVNAGSYTGKITVKDIAGNLTIETITITAQLVILDTTPPVITTNVNVTGFVIVAQSLASYGGIISKNDLKVLTIDNVNDDFDGNIPLSSVNVSILDPLSNSVNTITGLGVYTVIFTVTDSSSNLTTLGLTVQINA